MHYEYDDRDIGNRVCILCIGVTIGALLSFLCLHNFDQPPMAKTEVDYVSSTMTDDLPVTPVPLLNGHRNDTNNEAMAIHDQLARDVRILCWVLTCPANHRAKADHVANTWGKRCTKILFMSTENDATLDAVKLPVREGHDFLWAKTKASLQYIYEHHIDDFDWFMKADDDTYVIVENLRYLVYPYSTQQPIFIGLKFKEPNLHVDLYATGGSGYVMSREAVKRFVVDASPDKQKCDQSDSGLGEDVELSKCLLAVGAKLEDSRDSQGRQRFFYLKPHLNLMKSAPATEKWYWGYRLDPRHQGSDCCSDLPVSFHYVKPGQMYDLDYLIYKVHPYGIVHQIRPLPAKIAHNN